MSKKYSTYRSAPSPVFGKRLQAARKAWKRFTTALQSKIHELNLTRAIKNASTRGLEAAIRFKASCGGDKRGRRTVHNHFRHLTTNGQIYKEKRIAENNYDAREAETRVEGKGSPKSPYAVEDVWRAVVAMSPQLRPVDERAHDFISKVRQDLKIESQRSILEFQDMLKRSV